MYALAGVSGAARLSLLFFAQVTVTRSGIPMPNVVVCPSCNRKAGVADELLGRVVRCPQCGNTFWPPLDAPISSEENSDELILDVEEVDLNQADAATAQHTTIFCPHCHTQLEYDPELANHVVKCPFCNGDFLMRKSPRKAMASDFGPPPTSSKPKKKREKKTPPAPTPPPTSTAGLFGWLLGVPLQATCPKCRGIVYWGPCPNCNGTHWKRDKIPWEYDILGPRETLSLICTKCQKSYKAWRCVCGCWLVANLF